MHKTGKHVVRRAPDRTSRRCVNSCALQPLGDNSRSRQRETTQNLPRDWAWSPQRVAGPERGLEQHFVHHEQARREEPASGAGVETAEVVADTTGRGAAGRLGSRLPACMSQVELRVDGHILVTNKKMTHQQQAKDD